MWGEYGGTNQSQIDSVCTELSCYELYFFIFIFWQSHPSAKGLRNKSLQFCDELAQAFGKDRATGECVESNRC